MYPTPTRYAFPSILGNIYIEPEQNHTSIFDTKISIFPRMDVDKLKYDRKILFYHPYTESNIKHFSRKVYTKSKLPEQVKDNNYENVIGEMDDGNNLLKNIVFVQMIYEHYNYKLKIGITDIYNLKYLQFDEKQIKEDFDRTIIPEKYLHNTIILIYPFKDSLYNYYIKDTENQSIDVDNIDDINDIFVLDYGQIETSVPSRIKFCNQIYSPTY